nr:putative ribonuclease H-like domain-containing protein [Tanacetum cinerariifolium]
MVLKNKKDERGIIIRNKSRLVDQGHTHEEWIDYDEVFAPVARIEAIRLFLAYASFMGFTVYQMDVKSAFLYGTIDEDVYVMQPTGFLDPEFPAKVYKVEKAMYGLHQAPRAWYGTLSKYLLTNGFQRGIIDQTLFIKRQRGDFILVQVYVDDIIFGSSNPQLCREFEALMNEKFQMSAMSELNFFLGLQVLQKEDGIFLSQDKHQVTPKECHMHAVKRIFRYLKGHPKLGLWYPKESSFDLVAYSDSDDGGATQDQKSTIEGSASCCGQVLWIQNQLLDYGEVPCKLFPLLGKLSTVSVFLGFGLTFVGTSKYWGVLRILMISPRLIPLSEHNVDFHPIVDFVEASPLRIETTEEGTKILATVDGILRTVTESSLRRNLKLRDEEGISSLPDTELFENLTLMGYNISPNQNSNITTALVCLATNMTYNFLKMIFDGLVKNVNNKGEGSGTLTEPHHTLSPEAYPTSHTSHSSPTLPPVPTASILTVTPSETTPIRAELEIKKLKARVKLLEDREGLVGERSGDDSPIKGKNLDEGEAAAERVSDDTEEMVTVLTSMDAATVLASRVADVPTSSGSIPTADPSAAEVPTGSDVVPTAGPIFSTATVVTPYRRRKGKEIMVESETPKKKKVARDAEVARIHVEEELQMMINSLDRSNETVLKYLQELNKESHGLRSKRGITTWQSSKLKDFIPMGSKEKAKRLKRKGLSLELKSVKKLKTLDEVLKEVKSPDEVPEEKVKEMMQMVHIEEVYVEALQVKHPIIDWKVHTEGQRSYWKIIRLGGSSASYQFFVDLLKHMDREDLNQLWALVKKSLSNRQPTVEWKLCDMCEVHQVTSKDKEIFMLVEKDYPQWKGLELMMICYKLQVENYSQMANDLILKIYKIANCPRHQGEVVENKIHKAFPLPVIEFPLVEEVPTASEESFHCQKKREATAVKIALLSKSRRNYHVLRNIKTYIYEDLSQKAKRLVIFINNIMLGDLDVLD